MSRTKTDAVLDLLRGAGGCLDALKGLSTDNAIRTLKWTVVLLERNRGALTDTEAETP